MTVTATAQRAVDLWDHPPLPTWQYATSNGETQRGFAAWLDHEGPWVDPAPPGHLDHERWQATMEVDGRTRDRLRELIDAQLRDGETLAAGNELAWSDHQELLDDEEDRDPAWAAWPDLTVARDGHEGQGYTEMSRGRVLDPVALEVCLAEQAAWLLDQAREDLR